MGSVGEYLVTVTAAALVSAIAVKLISKGLPGAVVKLLCGVFVMLSVVSPLLSLRLDTLSQLRLSVAGEASAAAAQGEQDTLDAVGAVISERVAAYILDKAEALGAELTVTVTVSDTLWPVPESVCLAGSIAPYAKSVLSRYIADELGIDTEDQLWTS